MSKILILHPEWDNFCKYLNENMEAIKAVNVSTPLNSFFQKPFCFKFKIPHILIKGFYQKLGIKCIMNLVLGKWRKHITEYDAIILFNDVPCKWTIAKYISTYLSKEQIKIWFYDTIKIKENVEKECIERAKNYCDIFTFDPIDSKRFSIKFLPQFYLPYSSFNYNVPEKWDVLYCGSDKGRYEILTNLIQKCNELKLRSFFYIKKDMDKEYTSEKYLYSSSMDYVDLIKKIQHTKAIIEVNMSHQVGLSMRTMESIFYRKKLITNNKKIKDYDFYHPDNIFILDERTDLLSFLKSPYNELAFEIVEKYSFKTWLKNITSLEC